MSTHIEKHDRMSTIWLHKADANAVTSKDKLHVVINHTRSEARPWVPPRPMAPADLRKFIVMLEKSLKELEASE